jgi:hypothetical protein
MIDAAQVLAGRVAEAMRDADPLGRGYRGDFTAYLPQARIAITTVDAFREEEKRKNCRHYNKFGNGSLSSDGSSSFSWYCKDCGASGKSDLMANPAVSLQEGGKP